MGTITKGKQCSVKGCEKEALRSLSIVQVYNYLELKTGSKLRRAYLCKDHYKEYKKKSKKDKKTEKLRFSSGDKISGKKGIKGPMS
ncbi:MAG: hypothetical protein ACTSO9_02160 [Candidatus Helarchaeota archaeon]